MLIVGLVLVGLVSSAEMLIFGLVGFLAAGGAAFFGSLDTMTFVHHNILRV
jgi:hypothetical protein